MSDADVIRLVPDTRSLATLRWGPGFVRTDFDPSLQKEDCLDEILAEILHRLRQLQAESVGTLGKFIVEKKGGLWVAEDP